MPRPKSTIPAYRLHRGSGQAVVYINRREVYLGLFDSPESKQRYAEVIQQVTSGQDVNIAKRPPAMKPVLSVSELCLKFLLHAKTQYVDPATGKPSTEYHCFGSAVKHLRPLFGETDAAEFGPNKLRMVREQFIAAGWSRGFCNKSISRLRHIWKWGVSREIVPAVVLEGLRALEPLKAGKTSAPESKRRRAISPEHIQAMKERLHERNRDLVDLLLQTGARPLEMLSITTAMIQSRTTVNGVWVIDLEHHKTAHHGHERRLYFNATAQEILTRYLRIDDPSRRLFPIQRKTLGQAIKDACIRAGIPPFTSHWLRHTAGTAIADGSDTEAAQRVLGHANISMTSKYSTAADQKAIEAVKRLG